jgi:hypothetical protein
VVIYLLSVKLIFFISIVYLLDQAVGNLQLKTIPAVKLKKNRLGLQIVKKTDSGPSLEPRSSESRNGF